MTGIERLRELARICTCDCKVLVEQNKLADIADQIEREAPAPFSRLMVLSVVGEMELYVRARQYCDELPEARWAHKLRKALDAGRDPADDVSMPAYDLLPEDEREAVAWVREHGGLDSVKAQRYESMPRAAHERKKAGFLDHIAECETALGRRNQRIAELEERVRVRERANDELNEELNAMRPRLMTVDALRAAIEETCTRLGVEHTGDLTQDAQAIWREIGALGSRLKESVPRAAYERHLARLQRQIDESHAALRRRNARVAELETERDKLRRQRSEAVSAQLASDAALYDLRREVRDQCQAFGVDVSGCEIASEMLHDMNEALSFRLMPEGYEWPRYESGGLVLFGDEFINAKGNASTLRTIAIKDCRDALGGAVFWKLGKGACAVTLENGERVKRPAPKVLDSEGVECNVGDAVWWVHNKTGNFRIIRIEQDGKCAIHDDDADEPCGMTVPSTELTHKRPVIDADGVEIRVGDEVWDVDGNGPYEVARFTEHGYVRIKSDFGLEQSAFCERLTHRAPVLADDGKPLREGETVWDTNGDELQVLSIEDDDERHVTCHYEGVDGIKANGWWLPHTLTHERPESKCRDCAHWQKDPTADNIGVCWFFYHEYEGQDCYSARRADIGACEEFMPRGKELAERDA